MRPLRILSGAGVHHGVMARVFVTGSADAGRPDAVIHNAAVGYREPRRIATPDGLAHVFAINVLAPYLLTALIERPARLVYLSSGMQCGGRSDLTDAPQPHPSRRARRRAAGRAAGLLRRAFGCLAAQLNALQRLGVDAGHRDP